MIQHEHILIGSRGWPWGPELSRFKYYFLAKDDIVVITKFVGLVGPTDDGRHSMTTHIVTILGKSSVFYTPNASDELSNELWDQRWMAANEAARLFTVLVDGIVRELK